MHPEFDANLPVLILRTNRYPLHHGTLGAIRSLGRAGIEVHAVLEEHGNPSARSRYLSQALPFGPAPDEPDRLAAHLTGLAMRIGRRALLVPVDDAGALFAARHAERLSKHYVLPRQPPHLPEQVADKSQLLAHCTAHGIDCPPSSVPESAEETTAAVTELGLPLIAKWSRPWSLAAGQRSTTLVSTVEHARQLVALAQDPAHRAAGPLILQRLVGHSKGDWFFQGYFDQSSNCLFGGTGRKHLARPVQAGHTITGEWVANPELEQHAHALIKTLGYSGMVDLDFRETESRAYHLVDFNPRLGAQFRLFRDRQGLDLVRVQHLHQSGRPVPPAQPDYGRTMVVENHCLQHAVAHPTGLPSGLRQLGRAGEHAWYARDDMAPFLAMGADGLRWPVRALARRALRAGRRRP
ncbi:carboxylate--amine ligase [Actinomadura hibisca]|uniref:carboxylate--amine ligase n=1 Tax=Actinomadura hibisca TaxID=68565 RepID=UPI0008325E41|nr:hypothetical protein [Actinomadura hibisca]